MIRVTSDRWEEGIPQWGFAKKKVYMAQPKSFFMEGKVCLGCHQKKSIYALKQASRQ